ncbi:hypothetical protein OV203_45050 [Nannocystis sp. ILAH1]|uniref:hypothetical protein n=1 Tax=Nannocystis sp. ILAH1 TaxID=2996789 RepID=UPI0022701FD4|nr:hypothetical protein [Nannocystis sp. ILAH1]MCY0994378.1 hypothetical protein [Nannocystis sp. ILAH1]
MALVPETHLFPCARCSELLRVTDSVCPHCGVTRSPAERSGRFVALAAAFAMAACGTPSQPEYGGPDTESETLGTNSPTEATTTEATTTEATTTEATTTDATTTDATDTTAPTGTGTTATTDDTTG